MVFHPLVDILPCKRRIVRRRCEARTNDDRLAVSYDLHWAVELHLRYCDIPPCFLGIPVCRCNTRVEADILLQTPYFINVVKVIAERLPSRILLRPREILEQVVVRYLIDWDFCVDARPRIAVPVPVKMRISSRIEELPHTIFRPA